MSQMEREVVIRKGINRKNTKIKTTEKRTRESEIFEIFSISRSKTEAVARRETGGGGGVSTGWCDVAAAAEVHWLLGYRFLGFRLSGSICVFQYFY